MYFLFFKGIKHISRLYHTCLSGKPGTTQANLRAS